MNFYQKHNTYELYTRSNKDDKSFDPESKRKKGKEHTMTSDLFFFYCVEDCDIVTKLCQLFLVASKRPFVSRKAIFQYTKYQGPSSNGGARWLSGRVSDSGARGPGFETYRRRVVSLSKTLYSPKVLVNYPGSDDSFPT